MAAERVGVLVRQLTSGASSSGGSSLQAHNTSAYAVR